MEDLDDVDPVSYGLAMYQHLKTCEGILAKNSNASVVVTSTAIREVRQAFKHCFITLETKRDNTYVAAILHQDPLQVDNALHDLQKYFEESGLPDSMKESLTPLAIKTIENQEPLLAQYIDAYETLHAPLDLFTRTCRAICAFLFQKFMRNAEDNYEQKLLNTIESLATSICRMRVLVSSLLELKTKPRRF